MNNRIIIIILSALVVILVSINIFMMRRGGEPPFMPGHGPEFISEGPGMMRGGPHMPGNRFGRNFCGPDFMKEKLNLNDDQIKRIESLNTKYNEESSKYFRDLKPEQDKLRNIIGTANPDLAEARRILERMAALNVELHLVKIRQGSEIDGILTPEQKERLHSERRMFFEKRRMRPGIDNE